MSKVTLDGGVYSNMVNHKRRRIAWICVGMENPAECYMKWNELSTEKEILGNYICVRNLMKWNSEEHRGEWSLLGTIDNG